MEYASLKERVGDNIRGVLVQERLERRLIEATPPDNHHDNDSNDNSQSSHSERSWDIPSDGNDHPLPLFDQQKTEQV